MKSMGVEQTQKGYRERIKSAQSIEEARSILNDAIRNASEKSVRRCRKALEELPFTKSAH